LNGLAWSQKNVHLKLMPLCYVLCAQHFDMAD